MQFMTPDIPKENKSLRNDLYRGDIFLAPSSKESKTLIDGLRRSIAEVFNIPSESIQDPEQYVDPTTIYQDLSSFKKELEENPIIKENIRKTLIHLGFSLEDFYIDYPRLRVSLPQKYYEESMLMAYSAHRDTWYANPQEQINVWIPLTNVSEDQSFTFFPDYFTNPISNSSGLFDYDEWIQKVGWQTTKKGGDAVYPQAKDIVIKSEGKNFNAPKADCLLFSAHHLHKMALNKSDTIRFSIDFRLVHKQDKEEQAGPQKVDNKSQGDASVEYKYLESI